MKHALKVKFSHKKEKYPSKYVLIDNGKNFNLRNDIHVSFKEDKDGCRINYSLDHTVDSKERFGEITIKPKEKVVVSWNYEDKEVKATFKLCSFFFGKFKYIRMIKRHGTYKEISDAYFDIGNDFLGEFYYRKRKQNRHIYHNSGMDPDVKKEYEQGNDK